MATDHNLRGLSWKRIPGAFELLESGRLDEDEPQFAELATPSVTRGLSPTELRNRWRDFIQRLRGYRKDAVLWERQPVWIPIIDLHIPVGGRSTLRYERTSNRERAPELKILGMGFSSTGAISFSESVTFEANRIGKSLQMKMLTTASRYIGLATGSSLIRLDIETPNGRVEQKIVDLAGDSMDFKALDPLQWRIIHHVDLSSSTDEGHYTWQYKVTERSNWKVGLGTALPLQMIGLDVNVAFEVEHSDEFEVTFEMPYGGDYFFYGRTGESPLVPRCAFVGTGD